MMVGNGLGLPISIIGTFQVFIFHSALKMLLLFQHLKRDYSLFFLFTTDHNCYFVFYPWGFLIKDLKTKREIFKGFVDLDCIHHMTSQQIPILLHSKHSLRSIPTNSNLVAFQATKVSKTIWYARLGHPNSRILQLLLTCLPTLNKQVTFYQS
jgi:hypothetical protein